MSKTNMVHDQVWGSEARLPLSGCMLCISCLEARLGRKLEAEDFMVVPINVPRHVALDVFCKSTLVDAILGA